MYFYLIVALQVVQYLITTALHVIMCIKRNKSDSPALVITTIYHLMIAAIVIKFYFMPSYYDYGNTIYKFTVPFVKTGLKNQDKHNNAVLLCLVFVLFAFGIFYKILRSKSEFVRYFYGYETNYTIPRIVFVNTLICSAIDILITHAFLRNDAFINIFDITKRILIAMLMWSFVYMPLLIYTLAKKKDVEKVSECKDSNVVPNKNSLPEHDDNPYSYP